ncbi:MAG TPA: kelch repeat-containing protein, partial [Burkholderiaceae bacterium]|nr:kelch repeat-containing protein [Burkholderiaceae bacterium]
MKKRLIRFVITAVGLLSALGSPNVIFAQSSVLGEWSAVQEWPLEAIHATLLPTGKVMVWQTWTESVALWDPATGQFADADSPLHNPFCAGHAWLSDGRLLVAGGHINNSVGEHRANIYNPFTNTWADNVPNMPNARPGKNGRWYPSATTLGNGDVLVMAGDMDFDGDANDLPQVYQASTNSWRNLTGARSVMPYYPRSFLVPDGRVVSLATYTGTELINTAGTGSWSYIGNPLEPDSWDYVP